MSDTINHPPHYTDGKIEVIDYIEDKELGYHLGNVVKYVSRAGKKTPDPLEDLKKAQWYLDRYIKLLEEQAYQLPDKCRFCEVRWECPVDRGGECVREGSESIAKRSTIKPE